MHFSVIRSIPCLLATKVDMSPRHSVYWLAITALKMILVCLWTMALCVLLIALDSASGSNITASTNVVSAVALVVSCLHVKNKKRFEDKTEDSMPHNMYSGPSLTNTKPIDMNVKYWIV